MNSSLLQTVGQIAGIGGLALGVFFLLFRDLLRKLIGTKLSSSQWFRVVVIFMVLVWSIAVLGLVAWYLGSSDHDVQGKARRVQVPEVVLSSLLDRRASLMEWQLGDDVYTTSDMRKAADLEARGVIEMILAVSSVVDEPGSASDRDLARQRLIDEIRTEADARMLARLPVDPNERGTIAGVEHLLLMSDIADKKLCSLVAAHAAPEAFAVWMRRYGSEQYAQDTRERRHEP